MNPNNKRIRRFTAFILAAALLLGSLYGTSNVQAQQVKEATYQGQGYSITLTEQSSWGSGYTAQVDITNTGNSRITNWDIHTILKNGAIEDAWNATAEQNETGCLFSCQSYNRTIPAGQSITIGYRATGSGICDVTKMELTQKKKGSMDSRDYSLAYNIANQWGNQANIELTIYNNTEQTIHNWELTFELNAAIQSIWGATLLQQDNGVVTIDGTGNTQDIKAGQSITIGMSLTLDKTNQPTPANEQLSCTDGELIREPDGTEESSTTTQEQEATEDSSQQESTTEGNKDSETASGNSKASGDASGEAGTTEEQDITKDIDTDWDDTMIHAGDATVTQWKEQAEGSIKVAILDSGIDYWNDINVVERANFVTSYEDSSLLFDDLSGHGTAAAALLAADPEKWNGSMDNTEEEPEEEEIPEGYENMEEEDIENIDLGMLQSLTAQIISPGISKEEKEACEELKQVIEAIAQQQAEAGQEGEEEEDSETEQGSNATTASTTGKEAEEGSTATAETAAPAEAGREELPDASSDAKEPEGMEAFANLFNKDGKTVQGVNPNVDIYSARVLDDENEATISSAIEAIRWAMENEVQIIQIGFGIQKDNEALYQAIQEAHKKGILIIAPAGNGDSIEYPAAYEEVIAVGSVTSEGKRSSQCASGEALELMAPGEQVCSRGAFGILEPFSGTSMAVPQVTGLATLLWQKDLSQSADCIRKLMDVTANSLGEPELYGYGLIDCQEAIGKYHDFVTWYMEQKKEEGTGSGDATGEAGKTENGSGEATGQEKEGDSIVEQAQEELGENEQPVLVVDEDVVKGCWSPEGHRDTLTKEKRKIQALQNGIIWSDSESSKIAGMTDNPAFHGYYKNGKGKSCNYIEGYLCLVKAAQHFREHGTLTNFSYSVPAGSDELCGMEKKLKSDWMEKKIIGESKRTDNVDTSNPSYNIYTKEDWEKGAYFIYGMALHTLADAFAHSAYGYNGYTYKNNKDGMRVKRYYAWSPIRHGSCVIDNKKYTLYNKSDNKKYKPQRYQQAQIAVKTALSSLTSTHGTPFDNATSGSIAVFNSMTEAVPLEEADKAYGEDASGNPVPTAKRESYLKKQFGLKNFCKYLTQSCEPTRDAALLQSIKAQYGESPDDEQTIRSRWQRFDNDYVKERVTSWKKGELKVVNLQLSKTIKNFKVIDVTQSRNNIAANKKNKNKQGYKKKKEIVTVKLNGNKLALTKNKTYLVILRDTKVKKSMLKKAKAARANTVQQSGEEQPYTLVRLFTVGEDPEQAALSSDECTFLGGTVPIELDETDKVQATVDGGVVEMADTPGHVGKAVANCTVSLYPWDADFISKINDPDEPQPVPSYETRTDEEGCYRFTGAAPGHYILHIKGSQKFMDHYGEVTVKIGTLEQHNELIRLVQNDKRGKCSITGTIKDAVGKAGVEGLEVTVHATGRTLYGTTDAQGRYNISTVFAGSYRAEVSDPKGRYAATSFTIVIDGTKRENQIQDIFVSRKMEDGQIRIVATWEAGSTAYEGHVVLKNDKKPATDIDLYHKNVHTDYELIKKDGTPYAQIHGDFYSGTGPETFTLYDTSQSFDYYLYHLYEEGDKELKRQMGKIEIYQGERDKAVATCYVPYQDGCSWKAFHYDTATNTIKPVDKLTKYPNIQEDPDERVNPWKNGWTREAAEAPIH